jgi:uncharacterized membrane protein YgdD (TMEM256/DUF423 family)
MILHPLAKRALVLGSGLLALAVLIGAFGAHGLKNMVGPDKLVTFETGVRYHFYHAFGILILGLIQHNFQSLKINVSLAAFLAGIFLFSFNCYFYVLTGMKVFAMIVPVGGLLFVLGWLTLAVRLSKLPSVSPAKP